MLKKLTKVTAVAALTASSCLGTASTIFAKEDSIAEHQVGFKSEGNVYTFGNDLIERVFTNTDGQLKTKELKNYRTDNGTKVLTPTSSEEFVIQTLPKEIKGKSTVTVDEKVGTGEQKLENVIDGVEGTKDQNNFWASVEASKHSNETELAVEIDFGDKKDVKSVKYVPRYAKGQQDNGYQCVGRVEKAKIYYLDENSQWKLIQEEAFSMNKDKETVVQFENKVNTNKIKFVAVETYHWEHGQEGHPDNRNKVMSASEIDVLDENNNSVLDRTRKENAETLKSSELKLKGEPKLTESKDNNTLTFTFEPKEVSGVEYSIKEVLTMKDGDSFMRKHLEISVPEEDAANAKIDHIDLENMDFQAEDVKGEIGKKTNNYWTIPEQEANPHMAGQDGDFLELGQPYYVGAMYWGCEFPETENKIRENKGFIRYHFGKSLEVENQFKYYNNYNGADGKDGKMVTWDAVVGAARSTDYSVCQADFYDYIETIATDTQFRQQFNSWYDNMKDITAENIKSSFYEVEKGFTQHGVKPLDSYVVDDGWINYSSFWDFNRNPNKFPNELYDSSLQVNQLNSKFGLWLGPRGGYGTENQIANWIASQGLGSVNERSGNDINVADARYLNKLRTDIFLNYQDKFDINYWKLDGMLLRPSHKTDSYHVTGKDLYTVSETYERWTDIYEDMRENRGDKGLWINMTSYTNPSPWHLQWVNSVWMQNTGDTGFDWHFDATDQERMLTYRDDCYYSFFNDRQWQLPNKYFYNHDPVYAKTAHRVDNKHPNVINYSTEELREHLYMLGTRGTAFWEYYYSPEMFDDAKWQVNAESANWIEENFDILQKSQMFGGKPANGDVYGYSCWNGNEGIVSLRNPSDTEKTYEVTYDRLIGVPESLKGVSGKVIIGDLDKYQNDKTLSYGDKIKFTLKPKEVVIMQYGSKDVTPATVKNISVNGNNVDLEFNETLRTPSKDMFTVEGNKVEEVKLNADLRTVTLTLKEKLDANGMIKVSVNGVKDIVGNVTTQKAADDYYENNVVNSIIDRTLDGKAINKGSVASIDGDKGFTITGKINTTSKNATIVSQEDAYSVGIDAEGYLTFTLNGVTVNSKYVSKQLQSDSSVTATTKGIIADGKEHQFSAVKEVNGMLKLYIDGELTASAFDEDKANPVLKKGNVSFAKDLVGQSDYVSILDKALAYDEVANFIEVEGNVMSSAMNSNVKISAYDVTANKAVPEKSDMPFKNINDGAKDSDHYLELNDTKTYTDDNKHSRYVEIDLGSEYDLSKVNLTRYYKDERTYGPTVIALSNDKDFKNKTIVYNSDKTGKVHNLGEGKDNLYKETSKGLSVSFDKTSARYIRIYVNGNKENGTSDHIVEFEAIGSKKADSIYRVDYSQLESILNEDLAEVYTKSSINKYEKESAKLLKDAQTLVANKNAKTDKEVDDLVNSLRANQEKYLVKRGDVKELAQLVDDNSNRNKSDYKVSEKEWKQFTTALDNAKAIVKDNSDASQKDVDEAKAELEKMIEFLNNNKVHAEDLTPIEPSTPVDPEEPDTSKPWEELTPATPVKPDSNKPSADDKTDKVENEEKPNTGATSNAALLWTITLGAGAAAVALAKKKRKA